jgi:hypothetical protein
LTDPVVQEFLRSETYLSAIGAYVPVNSVTLAYEAASPNLTASTTSTQYVSSPLVTIASTTESPASPNYRISSLTSPDAWNDLLAIQDHGSEPAMTSSAFNVITKGDYELPGMVMTQATATANPSNVMNSQATSGSFMDPSKLGEDALFGTGSINNDF